MKCFKLLKKTANGISLVVLGASILGFGGCSFSKWFGCSDSCNNKPCKMVSAEVSPKAKNTILYEIETVADTSGTEIVKFKPQPNIQINFTLNDEPVMTDKGFEGKLMAMLGGMFAPGFSLKNLPKQQLDGLMNEVVKMRALRDSELKACLDDPAFREKLAQRIETDLSTLMIERLVTNLKSKFSVSDSEVREEYDNNKNRYIKELGGTRVVGVKFDSLDAAQNFESTANDKSIVTPEEFNAEGKMSGGQLRDLGRVSKEFARGVDAAVLSAIENQEALPSVELVTVSDNEHWVLLMVDTKETTYFSFDEARSRIEAMLTQKSLEGAFVKMVELAKVKSGVQMLNGDNSSAVDVALDPEDLESEDEGSDFENEE